MNDKDELGKTPSKYAGLKPDLDESFLPYWKKWNDDEKLEFVRYLERDTMRGTAIWVFLFTIFISVLIALFLLGGWRNE